MSDAPDPDMERHDLDDLRELMRRLRDPEAGCPWDLRQDHASLLEYTLEEVYEFADAVARADDAAIRDELGDYLFQAVFHAQVAAERGAFDFDDVTHAIVTKLLRRHPHVFPDGTLQSRREAGVPVEMVELRADWERSKQQERQHRALHGVLDDVPLALPALPRASRLQRRAASAGLDWPDAAGVIAKLHEELGELEAARGSADARSIAEEIGDLLFTCVNLARHLGVDAEGALRHANAKFEQRVRAIESELQRRGLAWNECSAQMLDGLWEVAKQLEGEARGRVPSA